MRIWYQSEVLERGGVEEQKKYFQIESAKGWEEGFDQVNPQHLYLCPQ